MNVRVRFFAGLRELMGANELRLDLPDGADVAAVLARLEADYPQVRLKNRRFTVAVNRAFARPDQVLAEGDEVALIPPVSGGTVKLFEVVDGPISLDEVTRRVVAPERGGITVFAGTVRGVTGEQETDYLEYEAYPEMAEASFERIADEAKSRWPGIAAVAVVHRVGRLQVGDVAIVIAVAAGHRAETFDACHYVIDRIKQVSPIWKKEVGPDGAMWIEGPESTV
ncbi:MAG: molybdopterin converting factor subunit 1 [Anaerolineae bacterium]|jgi:molybdopterin synthase catalytic subunit|nr:molybdopterin converting factor subunit 1 [Anaerolineae bacterium]